MRFSLNDLPVHMREQAQAKLAAAGKVRQHICADDKTDWTASKPKPQKRLNRTPQIPKLSDPEERLAFHLKAEGLTGFERQYRWCPGRAYRADFAWPAAKLIVEVQGGVHIKGARSHTGGTGYQYDRERTNEAVILGWRVLEFTPKLIKSGRAVFAVKRALEAFRT